MVGCSRMDRLWDRLLYIERKIDAYGGRRCSIRGKLKAGPEQITFISRLSRISSSIGVVPLTKFVDSAGDHYWKSRSDCLLGINVFKYIQFGDRCFLFQRKYVVSRSVLNWDYMGSACPAISRSDVEIVITFFKCLAIDRNRVNWTVRISLPPV